MRGEEMEMVGPYGDGIDMWDRRMEGRRPIYGQDSVISDTIWNMICSYTVIC